MVEDVVGEGEPVVGAEDGCAAGPGAVVGEDEAVQLVGGVLEAGGRASGSSSSWRGRT